VTAENNFRILCLDGGGAKGFYSLGVLQELEALVGPLHQAFSIIYGTSTGAIIGTLLASGKTVKEIHELYKTHIPKIMLAKSAREKSAALASLGNDTFKQKKFDSLQTKLAVVATQWDTDAPFIFKSDESLVHGRPASFVPGFGCLLSDAVQASCAAYPFFERKVIMLEDGTRYELLDGGFCANNPSLFALADATLALNVPRSQIRLLTVGVGSYPEPRRGFFTRLKNRFWLKVLLEKTLTTNTNAMDKIRELIFHDIQTVRVGETFAETAIATDLLESDLNKLDQLFQRGRLSFGKQEKAIKALMSQ
jgi:predicted acylesterase/phospholipase RssA